MNNALKDYIGTGGRNCFLDVNYGLYNIEMEDLIEARLLVDSSLKKLVIDRWIERKGKYHAQAS